MAEFCMPSLGADMDEGKLVEWLVKPGDRVSRGDLVAVVETSKAAVEVEIWEDGVIEELVVQPGETVPVGAVLARLKTETEGPASTPAPAPAPARPAPVAPQPASAPPPPASGVRASPRARKLARELGVDLGAVQGTGKHGAITGEDVERAAASGGDGRGAMWEAIAGAMTRSKREIPHYYLGTRVDLTRALEWLRETNQERPIKERLLPVALLLKAIARAAKTVPQVNGLYRGDRFEPSDAVHLGVAISLREGGLIAPAILDADRKSVTEVMDELRGLVERARAGGLRGAELSSATLTVSNLGDTGVETVFGVIQPPQVALVGLGKIHEEPSVVEGALVARPVVNVSLSADHRASVGHQGAKFLSAIARLLKKPEKL